MVPTRGVVLMAVAIAIVGSTIALAYGNVPISRANSAAPPGFERGTPIPVRYVAAPGSLPPSRRDATRRTAVLSGVAEVTVLGTSLIGSGPSRRVVVDTSILSMRHDPVVPSRDIRFELRDASGNAASALTPSRSLDHPLLGGDEERYQFSASAPTTSTVVLVVAAASGTDGATFVIDLQRGRP